MAHGRDEIPIVGWHGIDYDSHTFAADGNLRTVVVFGVAARTFQSISGVRARDRRPWYSREVGVSQAGEAGGDPASTTTGSGACS